MRNRISIYDPEIIDHQTISPTRRSLNTPADFSEKNASLRILNSEGLDNFLNYIEWLGFDNDPDMVILSSMHHYFYDAEEMKHIRTVINLKELNSIKHIEDFIHSVYHILSPKCYFLGCFIDSKRTNSFLFKDTASANGLIGRSEAIENGIVSRIPFLNMLYSIMDSRTNSSLSKRTVNSLFENRGFKILDITQLNNRTYFCAQKIGPREY